MKNLFIILIVLISCKTTSEPESQLGQISFEVTGNKDAVKFFHEGMLLLHSFEYEDAAEKFSEAQKLDPEMGMAFWGEAMTNNHPLWRYQNKVEALNILSELGATAEERALHFATPLEKDLHQAIEILYGDGTKTDRDRLYSDYLKLLREKYPNNHEVASMYALSILGAVEEGRDEEAYNMGAKIAEGILQENPNHPGALHYLIHSYDDPDHAHLALDAANNYSKVAPDAGHALHMPSHIYIALGMWDEVINSNIASWEASVTRKNLKNLDNNAYNYHALNWLMYAYLQKGNYSRAKELTADMHNYCSGLDAKRARSYLIMMKGAYALESNDWDSDLLKDTFNMDDLNVQIQAVKLYTQAMAEKSWNQKVNYDYYIEQIQNKISEAENEVLMRSVSTCSGNFINNTTSQVDIDRAMVIKYELEGQKNWDNGNHTVAEEYLKKAVDLEYNTSFQYGPPDIVKPSSELLAEFLIAQKRIPEAREYYQKSLTRAPKRKISMDGLNAASEA